MNHIGEFVLTLLHSQTNAHIMHLRSRSYAEHMALGAYYEGVDKLIDSFVEAYQGTHGLIEDYPNTYEPATDPIAYLDQLNGYIYVSRQQLPQDTELQNILDEIVALIDSTLYKLRFLK